MSVGAKEKEFEKESKKESKSERAEQAQIVTGLQSMLEGSEQLLGFTRGVIAGGLKGKLSVGVEALFAPAVNVGLTDRRILLQHIHAETGRPSEILPHDFTVGEVASIQFTDIETFGKTPAARLLIRMLNDQNFRIRLSGATAVLSAQTITEVFSSIIAQNPAYRKSANQDQCSQCKHILDTLSKFCPYCGSKIAVDSQESPSSSGDDNHAESGQVVHLFGEQSPPANDPVSAEFNSVVDAECIENEMPDTSFSPETPNLEIADITDEAQSEQEKKSEPNKPKNASAEKKAELPNTEEPI